MTLARFESSSNSYTTSWEAGATDERIQVEMCFTHTALEYLIIVSTPKLSLRIFLFIQ